MADVPLMAGKSVLVTGGTGGKEHTFALNHLAPFLLTRRRTSPS